MSQYKTCRLGMVVIHKPTTSSLLAHVSSVFEETCAFLIGHWDNDVVSILDIIHTPNVSQRPRETAYAISAAAWHSAAESTGNRVVGHVHSHVAGSPDPSPLDMRYIRCGEIGAVYHVRTSTLTWYTKSGVVSRQHVKRPVWRSVIAWLFCD